jgi:hypothetical protein
MPDPASLPPPPSVAVNPSPKSPREKVRVLVDTIPAQARYVREANAPMNGVTIPPGQERAFGKSLSHGIDQLIELARQAGANTVVLLSHGRGSAIPIEQSKDPLLLTPDAPRLSAILFDWAPTLRLTDKEKRVRFGIDMLPAGKDRIQQTITMELNTAGATMATWAYGNISRFAKEAVTHDLDAVSLRSSRDVQAEDVWLPGCDQPLKISRTKPTLEVTIFKRQETPIKK